MPCIVMKCDCRKNLSQGSMYQEETYGEGRRVFNETKSGDEKNRKYRCSVCGSEKGK